MLAKSIHQNFTAIGADVQVAEWAGGFEIDIRQDGRLEVFDLRLPRDGSITARVLDLDRRQRHLLLDVTHRGSGERQRYLCGHDEFHWFVAALPQRPEAASVPAAMESLKPQLVLDAQDEKRVKRSRRRRRRTAAYVRQGEWFFLPRPQLVVDEHDVERHGMLVRGQGKPHRVEWLYRPAEGTGICARGRVTHPDHSMLVLEVWHQVVQNAEALANRAIRRRMLPTAQSRPTESTSRFDMRYLD